MGLLCGDTYIDRRSTVTRRVTENINITEKRAPTDESLRMLQEMEDKVRGDILGQYVVNFNNTIEGAMIWEQQELSINEVCFHFKFKLNGVEHQLTHKVDSWDYSRKIQEFNSYDKSRAVLEYLVQEIGKIIAVEILKGSQEFLNVVREY